MNALAYLLLVELGDGPPPFLDFSNHIGNAPPPCDLIFWQDSSIIIGIIFDILL